MAPPLLSLDDIQLAFGERVLFSGLTLSVAPFDRIALVGRNGSGKSTLMKVIAGAVEEDRGTRYVDPGAQIIYLPQEPDFTGFETIDAYFFDELEPEMHGFFTRTIEPIIAALEIDRQQSLKTLSGGEARRVAIAKALASDPEILLLDEPTNHLDIKAIEWLENYLGQMRAALMVISHDRRFLEKLTNKTIWLDRGMTRTQNEGFKNFEEWRDKILDEEELEAHKLGRKIVAEEHWVRYGVTARRKRNVRRMKELGVLRSEFTNARRRPKNVSFSVNQSDSSGKVVIEADNICKAFGDNVIVDGFSVRITKGERLGFIGANGAGKSTLIQLLTGSLRADSGNLKLGVTVDMVSLDQKRATLKPGMRVMDIITQGRGDYVEINDQRRHVASYLKDFLFDSNQWRAPVESLSGGERGRLALAAVLAIPSNLLILDEPTNDLDLETLDLLQDILGDYQGTLILVSHDRSFLDRTVSSVIARDPINGVGKWSRFVGGYSDMLTQLKDCESDRLPKHHQKNSGNKEKIASLNAPQKLNRKLSYKEKYALETLPGQIASLESEIEKLRVGLAEEGLFQKDSGKFNKMAVQLEAKEKELGEAEEEWLMLEIKRDELAS